MDSLEHDNSLVLQAVQASLGLISCDVSGISISITTDRIVWHFALKRETEEVREDIEDMLFEFDALLAGSVALESRVYVGDPDARWPGRGGRLIYLAKR